MTRFKKAAFIAATTALVAALPMSPSGAATECRGQRATITGTSGDDVLEGTSGRDVIVALGGSDSIFSNGGKDLVCTGAGSDEAYGGPGNDTLMGQPGTDTLVGNEGDDKLLAGAGGGYFEGGAGNDLLKGGRGFDESAYRSSAQGVSVDLSQHEATGDGTDALASIEMVTGSVFNDTFVGSDADFEIFRGLAGDDSFDGRGGLDQVLFDESPAPVSADNASGKATGEGNDSFTDVESFVGSAFGDTLQGNEGSDDIYGYGGDDSIDGRAGNDYLLGQDGNDQVRGGPGEYDMLDHDANSPAVTVDLAGGTSSGEGSDQVSGFEIIGGTDFDDTFRGAEIDELYYPEGGNDSIDGRGGSDLVLYNATPGPITADLVAGTAQGEGNDSLIAIEGFVGSPADDTFVGNASDNLLIGEGGNDTLSGGDGDDYFEGNPGSDEIDGGPGTFDMLNLYAARGDMTVDLAAGTSRGEGSDTLAGVETVFGSSNDDTLRGDDTGNYLFGRDGDDVLAGRGGDDVLDGEGGANDLDGGPGTDACVAGQSIAACEGEDGEAPPEADAAQRAQELAELLADLFGRTK